MRQNARERLRALEQRTAKEIKLESYEDLLKLLFPGPPLPTQSEVLNDPHSYKAYMGQAGSGKSTLGLVYLMRALLLQPGCEAVIFRNDYNDLSPTMVMFERLLMQLPQGIMLDRDKSAPMQMWFQTVGGGAPSHLTWMGLKEANLGSYEFNIAFIEEADECSMAQVDTLRTRLRAPGDLHEMLLAFNPPLKSHWLYGACTGRDVTDRPHKQIKQWLKLFRPVRRENAKNLRYGYYDEMDALPEDLRLRLQEGEWGLIMTGIPVYREFKRELHVRRSLRARFDQRLPLFRFWDFGYNHPACVWAQVDDGGRLLHFKSEMGDKEEIKPFARRIQSLTQQAFPGASSIVDYGDPAANQKKDTGSTVAHLNEMNIQLRFHPGVTIDRGLRLMRERLNSLAEGEPAMQFDEVDCHLLIAALSGGYKLGDDGKPKKDNVYDHLADAERYGVWNIYGKGYATDDRIPSTISPQGNIPADIASVGD